MKYGSVFGVFLVLLISGCHREPVLARVGTLKITLSEFQRKLAEVAPEYQLYVDTPHGRRQFLDILIREKLILAMAKSSGVEKTSEYKAQVDQLKAEAAERLKEGRDDLLTHMWLDNLRRKGILSVTDADVRRYYSEHPVEIYLRHILLGTSEEAQQVLRRVRSSGRFAEVAQEKSLDAETASRGGVMDPAIYGEVIPELEDVVFKIRIGETVGPVRSKFGYHIIRKDSEKRLPFSQAEDRIRKVLEKQKLDQYLQSMQSQYPVEVADAQFN
jgi:peptidyl-prolyl cis-trans isomerase C